LLFLLVNCVENVLGLFERDFVGDPQPETDGFDSFRLLFAIWITEAASTHLV